jgi:hypothetical protein
MNKRGLFGKKVAFGSKDQQPLPMESQIVSLYQSINELPLSNFITCLVDNNLNALAKSGLPTSEQLSDAWNIIYSEYSDQMSDNEGKLYIKLYKEITAITIDIATVNKCLEVLQNYRVKQFEDMLQAVLRTSFIFDASNPEQYDSLLIKCEKRSRSLHIAYDLKTIEFKEIQKKFEKGTQPTREYFLSTLNILRLKYHEVSLQLTVFEFIDMIKNYTK